MKLRELNPFGCWPHDFSQVWTDPKRVRRREDTHLDEPFSYVTCLECGSAFEYDLQLMQLGPRIELKVLKPDAVAEKRIALRISQSGDGKRVLRLEVN